MADIVLVDDHPLLRKGLVRTIDEEVDLHVVGQIDNAEEALNELKDISLRPGAA